jgi:hypothetical protein
VAWPFSGLCSETAFAYEFVQGTFTNAGAASSRPCPKQGEAALDPIERAIRNALEKGDPLDPVFRQRVYASAEVALWRSMAAHASMTAGAKQERMNKLHRYASVIEEEFTAATEEIVAPQRPAVETRRRPQADTLSRQFRPETDAKRNSARAATGNASGIKGNQNKRRMRLFIYLLFLALAILLGWLFWTSGILDRWTSPNGNASASSAGGDGVPTLGKASDESEGWVSVFAPSDAASIELADGMSADLKGTGSSAFVLLKAPDGQPGNGVASIEVGRGLLENFRGKKIIFDIKAKAGNVEGAQISVACDLAGMGQCQRTRFRLDNQVGDNLVSVQLNDNAPEASGILAISPHVEGNGGPVEIHSIRVRVADEQQ